MINTQSSYELIKIINNIRDFLITNGCSKIEVEGFFSDEDKLKYIEIKNKSFKHEKFDEIITLNLNLVNAYSLTDVKTEKVGKKNEKIIYIGLNEDFEYKKYTNISGGKQYLFLFNYLFFSFNPLKNILQPPIIEIYRYKYEAEKIKEEIVDTIPGGLFPSVFVNDVVAKYFLAVPGDFIKYVRATTIGESIYYRKVIDEIQF